MTENDPNAAHITMIYNGTDWFLHFDFRYNATLAGQHLELAKDYLEVAKSAFDRGKLKPCVENLFNSTELAAKSILITSPSESLMKAKSHGTIRSEFNKSGHLGNVDSRFTRLINELWNLRDSA